MKSNLFNASGFGGLAVWTAAIGLALGSAACQIQAEDNSQENSNNNTADAAGGEPSPDPNDIPDSTLAISGKILDQTNLAPIQGAIVTTEPAIGQIVTNAEGAYVFTGDQGTAIQLGTQYRVTATRPGYVQNSAFVTVQAGHNRNVDILLSKSADQFIITAVPTSLNFGASDFTGDVAFNQVTLKLANDAPTAAQQSFTVDVPIQHQAWLKVQPNSGTVGSSPFKLNIEVNKAGITGTKIGAFDILGDGGGQITIQVTVNLTGDVAGGGGGEGGGGSNGGGGGGEADAGAPEADAAP